MGVDLDEYDAQLRLNVLAVATLTFAVAAPEGHTVNLAAELDGTGVTVNAFRPGTVDTAMRTWIRDQNPAHIGPALHERFTAYLSQGKLITADRAASALLAHLLTDDATGQLWT